MIKELIKKILYKIIKPEIRIQYIQNSYAQAGEDRILKFLLNSVKINTPSYIDVGANKPESGSNSYLFYTQGAKGICIEPDINLFTKLVSSRPNDICLNIAIGPTPNASIDFYVFDEPSVNTVSKSDAMERVDGGEYKLEKIIKVKVLRLEEVILSHCKTLPSFVSLDIEGMDYDVLASFDFDKYPIPIWVVETVNYSTTYKKIKNIALIELMLKKKYFVYSDTYINTIFVLKEWYESIEVN